MSLRNWTGFLTGCRSEACAAQYAASTMGSGTSVYVTSAKQYTSTKASPNPANGEDIDVAQ
ncbi:MAG TPA: hypothetical protein VGL64_01380 [Amycolatopsis sp.]